jgi:uncharacterized protein with NAD-binding domain and iron-sulfur cluster
VELKGVKRVGIIGAAVAGLATAKTLQAEGLDCTIFERAERIGGVWAIGYSNFGVQVQKEHSTSSRTGRCPTALQPSPRVQSSKDISTTMLIISRSARTLTSGHG